MAAFSIEKALDGKPVMLRSGCRAYVLTQLDKPQRNQRSLIGYYVNDKGEQYPQTWLKDGTLKGRFATSKNDIIGMWLPLPKLISNKVSVVDYFGLKIKVPGDEDLNYIATDADGCVYCYREKPTYNNEAWCSVEGLRDYLLVAKINLDGMFASETLKYIGA